MHNIKLSIYIYITLQNSFTINLHVCCCSYNQNTFCLLVWLIKHQCFLTYFIYVLHACCSIIMVNSLDISVHSLDSGRLVCVQVSVTVDSVLEGVSYDWDLCPYHFHFNDICFAVGNLLLINMILSNQASTHNAYSICHRG